VLLYLSKILNVLHCLKRVFSGAAFALMAWDQQADTGDRLIGGLPFFYCGACI
jgi:hypothetical protein